LAQLEGVQNRPFYCCLQKQISQFLNKWKKLIPLLFLVSFGTMLFSILLNIAFAFLGPLGAATLLIGDWMLNAFIAAKVVENVVPNGPAIVGNITAIFPVVFTTVYSVVEPALKANYSGIFTELRSNTEMGEWAGNMTQAILTVFTQSDTQQEL
jgi:hypothetical protein